MRIEKNYFKSIYDKADCLMDKILKYLHARDGCARLLTHFALTESADGIAVPLGGR